MCKPSASSSLCLFRIGIDVYLHTAREMDVCMSRAYTNVCMSLAYTNTYPTHIHTPTHIHLSITILIASPCLSNTSLRCVRYQCIPTYRDVSMYTYRDVSMYIYRDVCLYNDVYTDMHTCPPEKLLRGALCTPVPPFCLSCTIISNKTCILD